MGTVDDLLRWQREIGDGPPVPARIIASYAVPYGKAPRMWNTRGELTVYANRGQIEDMPRVAKDPNPFAASPIAAFGIPVFNDAR